MSTAATPSKASPAPAAAKLGLAAILIPVLLSTALTLAAVGGLAFWLLRSGRLNGSVAAASHPVAAAHIASHVMALEPMIVNLADGRSYLRVAISLRLRDDDKQEEKEESSKDPKAVDGAGVALRDTTLTVLSNSTADGLQGQNGREQLKKDLESAYKQHNEESHVLEVYFTEFLVQRG